MQELVSVSYGDVISSKENVLKVKLPKQELPGESSESYYVCWQLRVKDYMTLEHDE